MWYLYLVRCADGALYTGISTDVMRRLAEHAANRGARRLRGRVVGAAPESRPSHPVVVLVHGYGVTQLEWSLVWPALRARGYRVVAFDMRGHGRSTIGTEISSSFAAAITPS